MKAQRNFGLQNYSLFTTVLMACILWNPVYLRMARERNEGYAIGKAAKLLEADGVSILSFCSYVDLGDRARFPRWGSESQSQSKKSRSIPSIAPLSWCKTVEKRSKPKMALVSGGPVILLIVWGNYEIHGDRQGQVTVRDLVSGEIVRTFQMPEERVIRTTWLLEGGEVAAASQVDLTLFWDMETGGGNRSHRLPSLCVFSPSRKIDCFWLSRGIFYLRLSRPQTNLQHPLCESSRANLDAIFTKLSSLTCWILDKYARY